MNLPTNNESNKGLINESTKPSKYFPSYAMILVCLWARILFDGFSWGTKTRSGMLGVFPESTWTYVPRLLAKKGIRVMGHSQIKLENWIMRLGNHYCLPCLLRDRLA